MKKILYVLMLTPLLLLSACGSSANSSNPKSTESETTLSNSETDSVSSESQTSSNTESALSDDQPDDSTDSLDDLTRQAKELASSSDEITEGELYDSITAIYPDVVIHTNADNDLSVRINLAHDTIESDSLTFFEIIISICESCSLENASSNISFTMMVDDKPITMISFIDYASLSSFSTTEPFVLVDEYEETIKYIYTTLFSKDDISIQLDEYIDSLK